MLKDVWQQFKEYIIFKYCGNDLKKIKDSI